MSESLPAVPGNLDTLTAEILILKRQTAVNLIEIGMRLNQVKEMVGHGNWGAYLQNMVKFSERTAQMFMRVAREFAANPQAIADLDSTKVYIVMEADPEDRPALLELAPGVTTRQLEEQVRIANQARKEAERLAEQARKEATETGRRLEKAIQRAEAAESQPPKVIEKPVTHTVFQDSPETRAIIDRLSRDLLDKKQTLEQRQKDTDRLQKLLAETGKDLDKLRAQADRSATLETEIQEKAQQLQQLSAIHKRLGANFDDEGRDPSGGLKLLSAVRVVDDAMLTTIGDVQLLKRAGVGGWCEDERITELSKRLKQLAGLLDAIVEDREKRVIDVTPSEVQ